MRKPIAVLISDIHYNINTLQVADAALKQAVDKAYELNVRLIVAGDIHDTKANLRAECISAIMKTLRGAPEYMKPIVLVGNHDKINEKSQNHSLDFLKYQSFIVEYPTVLTLENCPVTLVPYQHDLSNIQQVMWLNGGNGPVIMHQGVVGSESGEYIQDKTALRKNDLKGLRVISGHYHKRQSFNLPEGGKFDYIGNPYTLGFGESNDPEKGFQVLYNDGSLEFIPTNLRKHRIINLVKGDNIISHSSSDILWIKVTGDKDTLRQATKEYIRDTFLITQDFRLELIPLETKTDQSKIDKQLPKSDLLDEIIDSYDNTSKEAKERTKNLWKSL